MKEYPYMVSIWDNVDYISLDKTFETLEEAKKIAQKYAEILPARFGIISLLTWDKSVLRYNNAFMYRKAC